MAHFSEGVSGRVLLALGEVVLSVCPVFAHGEILSPEELDGW